MPEFPEPAGRRMLAMSWLTDDDDDDRPRTASTTSPTRGSARTREAPARGRSSGPPTRTPCPGACSPSTAGGTRCCVEGTPEERDVHGDPRPRARARRAIVTGDAVDVVGDTSGDQGTLARIVRIEQRRTAAAPQRRRHRRGGAGHRRQRRPAAHRRRAADPEPRPRLDRPLPRRRVRRRARRRCCSSRRPTSRTRRRCSRDSRGLDLASYDAARRATSTTLRRGCSSAARRCRRPLRGRQVDARQRARAGGGPGDRRRQRGHRPGPAHLVELRYGVAARRGPRRPPAGSSTRRASARSGSATSTRRTSCGRSSRAAGPSRIRPTAPAAGRARLGDRRPGERRRARRRRPPPAGVPQRLLERGSGRSWAPTTRIPRLSP